MTEEQVRQVVREVVASLLAPKRALVLFTGGRGGFADAVDQLALLQADGFVLDVVQTDAARRVLDQDRLGALGLAAWTGGEDAEHPLLIVPTLSTSTAAKAAHGIADDEASRLIARFLKSGRGVVAARNASCPLSASNRAAFPALPDAYSALMQGNLETLMRLGVYLTNAERLHRAVWKRWPVPPPPTTGPKPVATERSEGEGTIQDWPYARPGLAQDPPATVSDRLISARTVQSLPDGATLRVGRSAVITALARDVARTRAIRIEREG